MSKFKVGDMVRYTNPDGYSNIDLTAWCPIIEVDVDDPKFYRVQLKEALHKGKPSDYVYTEGLWCFERELKGNT